jgi:hypothetical protein
MLISFAQITLFFEKSRVFLVHPARRGHFCLPTRAEIRKPIGIAGANEDLDQGGAFSLFLRKTSSSSLSRPLMPKPMKAIASFTFVLLAVFQLSLYAGDGKITGEAVCAKCELQQTTSCQMAIKVRNASGKEEIILADNNKVAKDFHDEICQKNARVMAEGVITEKDGRKTIALTKIDRAE